MLIHTIEIKFHEPFTGICVRGRNEYFFRSEEEIDETLLRWRAALRARYGETAEVVDITAEWSKDISEKMLNQMERGMKNDENF